jgi:phosphatidate cytidylyltransferase
MLKRIITSIVAVIILLPVLIFSDTVLFPIGIAIISLISVYEIAKCMGFDKRLYISLPIYIFSIVAPFLMRYAFSFVQFAMVSFIFAVIYLLYLFIIIITSHGKVTFNEASAFYTVEAYILVALNSIIYIRDFEESGKYLYLLIFIGAWITDIFAYFTGFLIGKHKLIEDVSPKKTIEGSIGGIVFCSVCYVIFGIIVGHFFNREVNLVMLSISGVLISVVSQIGDLIMSVIKRHYKIKDYGKLFPGHGGMLDRFDSVLAVSIGLACICVFVRLTGISIM